MGERRIAVIDKVPSLQKNREYINRLGTMGHSGDESDHAPTKRHYNILLLEWRADELTDYLRALDTFHDYTRFSSGGQSSRGNWVHRRIPGTKVEDALPISGLPWNFYKPTWLAAQTGYHLSSLEIDETIVDLSIPADVQE